MKVTLITGKQGSGKNKQAYELAGLGRRFIEIQADDFGNKHCLENLSNDYENVIIIDEVESIHLHKIRKFISSKGKISYRKPYTDFEEEFTISQVIILSQQDLSKSFRSPFTHIKL